MRWYEQSEQAYRGVRRIGYARDLWSAPAKRSDDGALTVPELRAERCKAGSRFACPRTPKVPAPQPNVARPTVPTGQYSTRPAPFARDPETSAPGSQTLFEASAGI